MAYTLAKSDNEDLASWDFSRNHTTESHSPFGWDDKVEYI
jgi:hypothetical protein